MGADPTLGSALSLPGSESELCSLWTFSGGTVRPLVPRDKTDLRLASLGIVCVLAQTPCVNCIEACRAQAPGPKEPSRETLWLPADTPVTSLTMGLWTGVASEATGVLIDASVP